MQVSLSIKTVREQCIRFLPQIWRVSRRHCALYEFNLLFNVHFAYIIFLVFFLDIMAVYQPIAVQMWLLSPAALWV